MSKEPKTIQERIAEIQDHHNKAIKKINNARLVLSQSNDTFTGKQTFNMILQNVTEFDSALVMAKQLILTLTGDSK